MKILSAERTKKADEYTIKHEPITSIDLMERASLAFTDKFKRYYPKDIPVVVIAGKGNNGGDGLAIARMLIESNYRVRVYSFGSLQNGSIDFKKNYERLKDICSIIEIKDEKPALSFKPGTVIIDAIFGTGLIRAVEGKYAKLVQSMNDTNLETVSVDVPSGLFCDTLNGPKDVIVKSSKTFTFQLPKLSFLLPENDPYLGEWEVLGIGLSDTFIRQEDSNYFFTQPEDLIFSHRKRKKFEHKGSFGKCLLIGGSYGKMGAVVLASKSCLKSGSGLVTAHVPKCGYDIIQSAVPEVMCSTSSSFEVLNDLPGNLEEYDAIGIGPGLGTTKEVKKIMGQLLENYTKPMVFDADALNVIASNNLLHAIPSESILTPHVKEFDRLFGSSKTSLDRIQKGLSYAREKTVVCVLKGAQ